MLQCFGQGGFRGLESLSARREGRILCLPVLFVRGTGVLGLFQRLFRSGEGLLGRIKLLGLLGERGIDLLLLGRNCVAGSRELVEFLFLLCVQGRNLGIGGDLVEGSLCLCQCCCARG